MNKNHGSLLALERWLDFNGWTGYDPYDIKGSCVFIHAQKHYGIPFFLNNFIEYFPKFSRLVFHIRPAYNAKAMALFARGYLNLYRASGKENYLDKARHCLMWLTENPSRGYSGYCWGYPFDWQSIIFIPKGTPSGVVTSQAAHAFMDAYEVTHDQTYLEVAKSCCSFIHQDLKKDTINSESLCFSYTPIDTYHVHNANLWAASVLIRMWSHSHDVIYKETALKAYKYTLNNQNSDGSWLYWGPPDTYNTVIDNYHTGFVLECLNTARRVLGDEWTWDDALQKGLNYYMTNLFLDDGTPRLMNNATYPIDIHSLCPSVDYFFRII